MIRVLVADDHAIVRQGLRRVLAEAMGNFTVGEAEHANEAIRKLRNERWDVLILDLNLPGKTGLDALKQIRAERPETKILVFSFYSEEHYALRVLRAGAHGYITKSSPPEQLLNAVRRVAAGGKYITQSVAEKLANTMRFDLERPLHERLTDREFQIFNMLAGGRTVSQIAVELSLSVKTISTHRTKILSKLSLRNNAELMHYYLHHVRADAAHEARIPVESAAMG
jgi:two-component system invasion response regulator UvrY